MKKIALIGCTSDKLDGPCRAIEMYTKSNYFKSKLKYCEKINVDEIFILSAKYGFLKPDTIIEYYDETLKGKPKDHKIKWTKKVLDSLKENCDIDLIAEYKDKNIIISVKDYGPGLPEEVKEKLFKEMITTKGKNGTGLGLFMSYSNIKAHFGGEITFESSPDKGTIFNIILP